MSPPAHPLLALACVALLTACSATARPDGQVYPGKCTTFDTGDTSNLTLIQSTKHMPAGAINMLLRNDCKSQGLELVGERVTACNKNAAPTLFMTPWPTFTPVHITSVSVNHQKRPTQVYIKQKCHVVIPEEPKNVM